MDAWTNETFAKAARGAEREEEKEEEEEEEEEKEEDALTTHARTDKIKGSEL